jgi:hydroxyacylglutathione hydrolase
MFLAVLVATLAGLLLVTIGVVIRLSKLSEFENPSFSFRLQYALYTSPVGQWIHNYFLRSHRENPNRQPHSLTSDKFENFETFSIYSLPFLEDNYAYFLIDHETGETAVVDPADADLVLETFEYLRNHSPCKHELCLTTILCTHKHMDHAGGNSALKSVFPDIQIVSGAIEQVSAQTMSLSHQDTIRLGSTTIQVLETPCHTIGHVVFLVSSDPDSATGGNTRTALFSGDILFVGGCGRFFEGNGTIMLSTLQLIKSLPPATAIFCGHEYTVNNLSFCLLIEPSNEVLQQKVTWAQQQRLLSQPTVPSLLSEELQYNAFLRYDQRIVMEVIEKRIQRNEEKGFLKGKLRSERSEERKVMIAKSSHVAILEELRRWRNLEK